VPNNNGAQTVVYFYDNNYLTFNGLTVRGSGAGGIWGYGSNIIVSNCNLEFNGKAGVNFMTTNDGPTKTGDQVLYTRVAHNVLLNWPRGNNGFAEAGGGWSGGLAFSGVTHGMARGNVVYDNGGEGIISYGSSGGNMLFEQNVAFDNWSVNMYFDNQPNDVARQNILFNRPMNTSNWLKPPGAGYPWSQLYKFNVCLMLADEQSSSDAIRGYANLNGTQVYNNLIVGCRIGIRDYSEGLLATASHGLKNTLIANNTIIMQAHPLPPSSSTYTAGLQLQNNGSNNVNSLVVNNVIVGFTPQEPAVWSGVHGPIQGITFSHNNYFNASTPRVLWMGYGTVDQYDFEQWQSNLHGDAHSAFRNPDLVDLNRLDPIWPEPFDYRNAQLTTRSPLCKAGMVLSARFDTNLAGARRSANWSVGAF
jgi:hypothetical protein